MTPTLIAVLISFESARSAVGEVEDNGAPPPDDREVLDNGAPPPDDREVLDNGAPLPR